MQSHKQRIAIIAIRSGFPGPKISRLRPALLWRGRSRRFGGVSAGIAPGVTPVFRRFQGRKLVQRPHLTALGTAFAAWGKRFLKLSRAASGHSNLQVTDRLYQKEQLCSFTGLETPKTSRISTYSRLYTSSRRRFCARNRPLRRKIAGLRAFQPRLPPRKAVFSAQNGSDTLAGWAVAIFLRLRCCFVPWLRAFCRYFWASRWLFWWQERSCDRLSGG